MTLVIDSNRFQNAWANGVHEIMMHGINRPADDKRAVLIRHAPMVVDLNAEALADVAAHRLHTQYPQQHGIEEYIAQFDPESPQAQRSVIDQPYTYLSRSYRQVRYIDDNNLLAKEFNKRVQFTTWSPFEDLGSPAPPCFDDETEVLTYDGWMFMKDISFHHLIATLNDETGHIEYHTPYNVIHKPYNGMMCAKASYKVNYRVTPNHNMYVSNKLDNKFKFVQAKDINKHMRVKSYALSNGNIKNITIGDKTHDIKDFAKFLAIYLSDGSCTRNVKRGRYRVRITQKRNIDAYIKIVDALGYKYSIVNDVHSDGCIHIVIHNKYLHAYVSQFGRSSEKYIPDIIKHAGSNVICEFLNAYKLGDYHINPQSMIGAYGSISKQLIDDIQELLILSGKDNHPCIWSRSDNKYHEVSDKYYDDNVPIGVPETIQYNGMIHCVEVPNSIIMVRRHGKPMWCGNCFNTMNLVNIGGGRIHATAYWRSHDFGSAWQWNIIALYEYINRELLKPHGYQLVHYTEFNASAHVYEYDWQWAEKVKPMSNVELHFNL